jgi:hypothetical protein
MNGLHRIKLRWWKIEGQNLTDNHLDGQLSILPAGSGNPEQKEDEAPGFRWSTKPVNKFLMLNL